MIDRAFAVADRFFKHLTWVIVSVTLYAVEHKHTNEGLVSLALQSMFLICAGFALVSTVTFVSAYTIGATGIYHLPRDLYIIRHVVTLCMALLVLLGVWAVGYTVMQFLNYSKTT